MMKDHPDLKHKRFKVPYLSGRYIVPAMFVITIWILVQFFPDVLKDYFKFENRSEDNITKLPMLVFIICSICLVIASFFKKLSLIPVLGLLSCLYIMTGLGYINWLRFVIWLAVGLVIYFAYGIKKSKLVKE